MGADGRLLADIAGRLGARAEIPQRRLGKQRPQLAEVADAGLPLLRGRDDLLLLRRGELVQDLPTLGHDLQERDGTVAELRANLADTAARLVTAEEENAAATTCLEITYGFEPGSFIRLLPGTPVDHQFKPG
jgi:hypothetical protein